MHYCDFWDNQERLKNVECLFIPSHAQCQCHFWENLQELIAKKLEEASPFPFLKSVQIYSGYAWNGPVASLWNSLRKIMSNPNQSPLSLIIALPAKWKLFLKEVGVFLLSHGCPVSAIKITRMEHQESLLDFFSVLEKNRSVHKIQLVLDEYHHLNLDQPYISLLSLVQRNPIIDTCSIVDHDLSPVILPALISKQFNSRKVRSTLFFKLQLILFHRAQIKNT